MPICTSCTHPTPYLYTVYNSENNLRLEQCKNCHAFADPYVEHDTLTLILDLILLKRDVYRHLLFNRGTGVRRLSTNVSVKRSEDLADGGTGKGKEIERCGIEKAREKARWIHILKLGAVLISVDAFIRWTHLSTSQPSSPAQTDITTWNAEAIESFLRVLVGCLVETVAFHAGITLACYILLTTLDWVHKRKRHTTPNDTNTPSSSSEVSGISQEFRYSHVPLTLLYSSLTKLFLLFLLSIWRPTTTPSYLTPTSAKNQEAAKPLPPEYNATLLFTNPFIISALELLDEDKLDREWVVRNVLGGMAAGFGLRVVLDCHPIFTTMVILIGWAVKTAVAHVVSGWVGIGSGGGVEVGGSDQTAGEMWLAYSIP